MTAASPLPVLLDHLVLAGPELDALDTKIAQATGIRAQDGGQHPTGTRNRLIALTVDGRRRGHYLELLGPDPERGDPDSAVTAFGIDRLSEPALVAWAAHPDDVDAAVARAARIPYDAGTIEDLSRRRPDGVLLEWILTRGGSDAPVLPFLINWGSSPHPGDDTVPELELASLTLRHPEPLWVESVLSAWGIDELRVSSGPAVVRAVLRGPGGSIELSSTGVAE